MVIKVDLMPTSPQHTAVSASLRPNINQTDILIALYSMCDGLSSGNIVFTLNGP